MPVAKRKNRPLLPLQYTARRPPPEFLRDLVVRPLRAFVRFVVTLCRGFFFARLLLPRAHFDARSTRASDDMAAVQYFGNGTDASPHPRRADFARNPPVTPFDGNPTRFVFVFVHGATASDHFPPTRPDAQLPRCTWPRRPPSAWASASSPVPPGRYASRPAKFEPRRALAGPRHPARLTPAETKKYPHGPPSALPQNVRTRG